MPKHYEAMPAEDAALRRSFGAMPLIVLTQSRGFPYDVERAELKAQHMIAWGGHVVLAGRSTHGKLVMPARLINPPREAPLSRQSGV